MTKDIKEILLNNMANNTITIPRKEYQELKIRASAFNRYLREMIKEKILEDFEVSLKETNLYKEGFIEDLVEAKKDILEGNIKEVYSLKEL